MSFLSRFFRSNTKLSRPNFSTSRLERFDFSGNLVEIKDPPQNANLPFRPSRTSINVLKEEEDSKQKWGNHIYPCYERGWNFFGGETKPIGGVRCDLMVNYIPQEVESNFNIFSFSDHSKTLLLHWHILWGEQAGASNFGIKGDNLDFAYPVTEKDITIEQRNGLTCLKSVASYRDEAPTYKYSLALSARHCLVATFRVATFQNHDYHSPATNLKETATTVIDDFMKNIKVTYTKQSLKDMDAAKSLSKQ